jgi:hypothetical protein
MKVMSIIGIVWFSLSLICIIGFIESNLEASAGWGVLGMLFALPYAIVGLVNSNKKSTQNAYVELIRLKELQEKGIISEDEFNAKKVVLLKG